MNRPWAKWIESSNLGSYPIVSYALQKDRRTLIKQSRTTLLEKSAVNSLILYKSKQTRIIKKLNLKKEVGIET